MGRPKPEPAGPGQESVWKYPRPAVAEAGLSICQTVWNEVVRIVYPACLDPPGERESMLPTSSHNNKLI